MDDSMTEGVSLITGMLGRRVQIREDLVKILRDSLGGAHANFRCSRCSGEDLKGKKGIVRSVFLYRGTSWFLIELDEGSYAEIRAIYTTPFKV